MGRSNRKHPQCAKIDSMLKVTCSRTSSAPTKPAPLAQYKQKKVRSHFNLNERQRVAPA